MSNKNKLISKIMFFVSLGLFFIFLITTFFGGQKIAGSIYFIFFAVSIAFACLDRKYNSSYFEFYRYAVYLDDLINILAVSTMIYYKQDSVFMIILLCFVGVGLFVDLLCKNRLEKRKIVSIIVSVLNCVLMLTIFPYFFFKKLSIAVPIIAVIVGGIVAVLKIVLSFIKEKDKAVNVTENENHVLNVTEENNVE